MSTRFTAQLARIEAFIAERYHDESIPPRITGGYWKRVHRLLAYDRRRAYDMGLLHVTSETARERYFGATILQAWFNASEDTERTEHERALDILRHAAMAERSGSNQVAFVYALGASWDTTCLEVFLRYAFSLNPYVRTAVAESIDSALDETNYHQALETILAMTCDSDPDVRDWSTFVLGTQLWIYGADSYTIRAALLARIKDRHYDTRSEALLGLARRKEVRAIPELRRRLQEAARNHGPIQRNELEAAGMYALPDLGRYLLEIKAWWGDDSTLDWAIEQCASTRLGNSIR